MSTSIQWIAAVVVAIAVTAFAAPAAWAGQEEQFTPEYKTLRSVADPKHTPKIVAPDAVKRGQGGYEVHHHEALSTGPSCEPDEARGSQGREAYVGVR